MISMDENIIRHTNSRHCRQNRRVWNFQTFMRYLAVRDMMETPDWIAPPEVHPWRWKAMLNSYRKNNWTQGDFCLSRGSF